MPAIQSLWPTRWLMTDPRLGDRLWAAIERVPEGGGLIFRHQEMALSERAALGEEVARRAKARGLVLGVAGDVGLAEQLGAALVHNPRTGSSLPQTRSVHDEAEADAARRIGAELGFVSPVFATSSHSGAKALGPEDAQALARRLGRPAIALGGLDEARFRRLSGFYGWAGIDAWAPVRI